MTFTRLRRPVLLGVAAALLVGGVASAVVVGLAGDDCRDAFADVAPFRPADRGDAVPDSGPIATEDLQAITAGGVTAGHPVRWSVFSGVGAGDATVIGDRVVVRDAGAFVTPRLRAYDVATGEVVWQGRLPEADNQVLAVDDAVAVAVRTSATRGALRLGVVDRSGRVLRCRSFSGDAAGVHYRRVNVAGDGHRLVVVRPVGSASRVELFEGPELTRRWSVDLPFETLGLAIGGDTVVTYPLAPTHDDHVALAGLDAATGTVRWTRTFATMQAVTGRRVLDAGSISRADIVGDQVVFVAGDRVGLTDRVVERALFAVATIDGSPRWHRADVQLDGTADAVRVGDVVVVTGAVAGPSSPAVAVVGLDAASGRERWHTDRPRNDGGLAVGAHGAFLGARPSALDPANGAITPLAEVALARSVAAGAGVVVFVLSSGVVVALDDPA